MITNLILDNDLIQQAVTIGQHKNNTDAVTTALMEYIQKHRQYEIINLFKSIEYEADYDYKAMRNRLK